MQPSGDSPQERMSYWRLIDVLRGRVSSSMEAVDASERANSNHGTVSAASLIEQRAQSSTFVSRLLMTNQFANPRLTERSALFPGRESALSTDRTPRIPP